MSIIHPVPNALEHIQERTQKLLNFNEVRIMELLENIQYGLGYMGLAFIIGVSLDYLFPKFDEEQDTRVVLDQRTFKNVRLPRPLNFSTPVK